MNITAVEEALGLKDFVGKIQVVSGKGEVAGVEVEIITDGVLDAGGGVFGELAGATVLA